MRLPLLVIRLNKLSQQWSKSGSALILRAGEKMQFLHFSFSPGCAGTLARKGKITNQYLIAYSLNISAKNYQKLVGVH